MSKIVDDKTCMIRVDSADGAENSKWKSITESIGGGKDLPSSKIEKWFRRITIRTEDFAGELTREQQLIAKAVYGMLQITCVSTDGKRVGVFLRQKEEGPTGHKKITSGYSLMRSWSPYSTDVKSIQAAFMKKTGFLSGRPLEIKPFGLGYNDLLESPESTGPGYLFMVHKAVCTAADFPSGEQGSTDKKSGEKFIGFFDPQALYEDKASHQDEIIKFDARMDNLILRSLATGERKTSSGELAVFNQDSRLSGGDIRFKIVDHPTANDSQIVSLISNLAGEYGPIFCANFVYDALKAGIGITAYVVARKIGL